MEIYIDNYKGFSDTIIPLRNVNFLVGENSTGKTAVLNLLELITEPGFWFCPDFNSDNIELGYFSEMVNQNSQNKKFFSIGANIENENKENETCQYIWMKFKEKDSAPVVSEFKFIFENKDVYCQVSEKEVVYQKKNHRSVSFLEWVRDFKGFSKGNTVSIGRLPLFGMIRKAVEDDMMGGKLQNRYVTFSGTFNRIFWIAPIRAKARRWYESYLTSYSPEGSHVPQLLKRYKDLKSTRFKVFRESLNEFGKNSGLFDEVVVQDEKSENPFSICVKYGKLCVNIANAGYGISQVLPLVVEMLRLKGESFAIQQPEVHLHPKAQSAFGELVYKVVSKNKNKVIIETHSEYLINRFRYNVKKGKNKIDAQVLFFSRDEKGIHIDEMPIDSKGQYDGEIPQEFESFFLEEELKMLEI